MPERPDLEYVVPILARELAGAEIESVFVKKPVVLRVMMREKLDELMVGRTIEAVERIAHFVLFRLTGPAPIEMPIAPMLAGRFSIDKSGTKRPGDLAVAWTLKDGRELRYRDDVQMGKVFVVPTGKRGTVPGLSRIGVDVLNQKAFTFEAFRAIARQRRDQVKVFLMDKTALDAMGNAYADEVLFEAQIHPKAMARSLPEDALRRLHTAIVKVLTEARDEVARRQPATHEKVRDFLKVRNRAGQPCPRCGDRIRRAGVRGHDAFFCPRCQPDGRSSSIVDWSRIPPREAEPEESPIAREPPSAKATAMGKSAIRTTAKKATTAAASTSPLETAATKKPATNKPATNKPATKKPATKKPATKAPSKPSAKRK